MSIKKQQQKGRVSADRTAACVLTFQESTLCKPPREQEEGVRHSTDSAGGGGRAGREGGRPATQMPEAVGKTRLLKNVSRSELSFIFSHRNTLHTYIIDSLILCYLEKWQWKSLNRVRVFVTPWTIDIGLFQARILGWVAVPFCRGSSQPRDRTQVSCIAGRFFTTWATREALERYCKCTK